ncbi:hypothetical protein SPURM210S_08453 [Streptomyces purpurascens]
MSRAVLRVVAWGRTSPALPRQSSARSFENAVTRSKPARSSPAPRHAEPVGQRQSSGVLRPMNRGSTPTTSYRAATSFMALRTHGGSPSDGPPGPPPLSSSGPTRRAVSVARIRDIATVIERPPGFE